MPEDLLGTFTGQIIFEGEIPTLEPIVTDADPHAERDLQACNVKAVPDETFIVDPRSKGIANVFVYLQKPPVGMPERLARSDHSEISWRIEDYRFQPHAFFSRTDQAVVFDSRDPVGHNDHKYPIRNPTYGRAIHTKDRPEKIRFRVSERIPMKVGCDVHPWMSAWWLVLDHPYSAITDRDGKFTIKDLPPGDHEFVVWHEKKLFIDQKLPVIIESQRETKKMINVKL